MSRYEVIEVIGRGTTSVVYRAHDTVLDRSVALKEVQFDEASEMALAEARAVARISHPNVVTVHDVFIESERRMIAMELLEGPTLRAVLEGQGVLALDLGMYIGRQIAASLGAAHSAGVVHRDIKPDNIFVLSGSRVVVSDFGLSLTTLRGGTPGYMSPEQWQDEETGSSGDVFAWACVLVECLTGMPPFGVGEDESRRRTLDNDPQYSLEWPALERLVSHCLASTPERRPVDGTALLEELDRLGSAATLPTAPSSAERAPTRPGPVRGKLFPHRFLSDLRLLIYPPDNAAWVASVEQDRPQELGREADIPLHDPMVSRRHARISWNGYAWMVTDLGSLNGTCLNGQLVSQATIEPGDVITVGSTVVRVEPA